jgi:hypothetical protein
MAAKKIVFVSAPSGDWEGLYIDGKLNFENHSLRAVEVLDALGIEYREIEADVEWLAIRGRFPDNLAQVKHSK